MGFGFSSPFCLYTRKPINKWRTNSKRREREREQKRRVGLVVVSKKSCWFWFWASSSSCVLQCPPPEGALHQFPGRAFSFTPPKKSLLLLLLLLFSLFFSCCCCCCCCCYCVLSVCLSVPTSPGSFLPHLCSLVSFFQQIELTTSPFSSLHFLSSRTLFPTHIHAHPILFLPLLFAASFPSLFFAVSLLRLLLLRLLSPVLSKLSLFEAFVFVDQVPDPASEYIDQELCM